jgi:hypothetical protein
LRAVVRYTVHGKEKKQVSSWCGCGPRSLSSRPGISLRVTENSWKMFLMYPWNPGCPMHQNSNSAKHEDKSLRQQLPLLEIEP